MVSVADFTVRQRLDQTEEKLREMRHSLGFANEWGSQQSIELCENEIVKLEAKARFLKAQLKGVCGGR